MKFVNRFVTAEDQRLNGVREGLVLPHETVKGLQRAKRHHPNLDHFPLFSWNLFKVGRSSDLCDDLQVFDQRPLRGQQFFGDKIGLICGKLLDTSTNT